MGQIKNIKLHIVTDIKGLKHTTTTCFPQHTSRKSSDLHSQYELHNSQQQPLNLNQLPVIQMFKSLNSPMVYKLLVVNTMEPSQRSLSEFAEVRDTRARRCAESVIS